MSKKVRLKKPLKQRLLRAAAVLVLLLVAFYFALTSTAFVRQFVLPPIGELIGAEITVSDTVIRPFSRFELHDLRVQTGNDEPVLEVEILRARYDVWALLRGRVVVHECVLVSPRVQLIHDAEGKNNLPRRFAKAAASPASPYKPRTADSGGPRVAIRNFSLTKGQFEIVRRGPAGAVQSTILSNLSVHLDRIENGTPGKLTLGAGLRFERGAAANASNDFFTAQTSGEFSFETTDAPALGRLAGDTRFEVDNTGGALRDLAALQGRLELLLEDNKLSKFDLRFEQRGARVGSVQASGTFDLAKSEGQLRFNLDSINRQVLNILTASRGIEFTQSAIGGSVVVSLTQGGQIVTAGGQLLGRQLGLKRAGLTTPQVDCDAAFDLRADRGAQRLSLQKFQLTAKQGATELVTGRLDYPMELSWATNSANSFTKSTFSLALRQCDLAEWRALHGRTNLAGQCDAQVTLTAAPGDKRLQLTASTRARDLVAGALRQRQFEATFNAVYAVTNGAEVITGTVSLQSPAAAADDTFPARFKTDAEFELLRKDGALKLQPCVVRASHDGAPGGTVELEGLFTPAERTGGFQLKLSAVNERVLAPFLGPAVTPATLASAALNGSALLKLGRDGQASTDTDLSLSNFLLTTPGVTPGAPLSATLKLSAESRGPVHQLKQLLLNLAPGAVPANEVELTGSLDLRGAASAPSWLALKAAGLDVTPWWNAFAPPDATVAAGQRAASAPSPTTARRDPEPLVLPVKQFALDASIGRLIARQIVLSNLVVTARLTDGLLAIKPLEATLNGAQVRGLIDANVGVPGWLYNVDLALDRVPLRPLGDSFAPARPGAASGELTLKGELKGAGFSDESLRQKLNGTMNVSLTNASVQLAQGWKQGVLREVASLLRVPELVEAPVAWAAGGVTVGGGQLDLSAVQIGTEAMVAGITGRIPLAEVLTNSPLDLPVALQLRRSLAEKAKLGVSGPPDAPFVPLPDFLRVKGTLGRPRSDINKLALGGVLLQTLGNVPGLGDDKTRAILQGIGGLLNTPKTPATNAPATSPTTPPAPRP